MKKEKGYLKVSKIHSLHYRLYGDVKKPMIIYLHGGPGYGQLDEWKYFIDFKKYCFLSFDQRGAGLSKPYADLRQNTTKHLVEDVKKFQTKYKKEKVIIIGDSWGTTLGLSYALKYPKNVEALILNGIFLGRKKEIKWIYEDAPKKYQKTYEKIFNHKPMNYKKFLKQSLKQMSLKNDYYAKFALWEDKLSLVGQYQHQLEFDKKIFPMSKIEAYYFLNDCFLDSPILSSKNRKILETIPIVVNHGIWDRNTLMETAEYFASKVNSSVLNRIRMHHYSADDNLNQKMLDRSLKQIKHLQNQLDLAA